MGVGTSKPKAVAATSAQQKKVQAQAHPKIAITKQTVKNATKRSKYQHAGDYRKLYNIILCDNVSIIGVEPTKEAKRAYIEEVMKKKLSTKALNLHNDKKWCDDPLRRTVGLMDDFYDFDD